MGKLLSKIIQTYRGMSAPAKATVWFAFCNILQKGISFLTTPVFTRLLTPDQYGVYSIYQSWYAILGVLATFNLHAGVYNNGMTKYPDDRPALTSAQQSLSTVITVCLLGVYLLAMDFWNGLLGLSSVLILAMFLEFIFQPAYLFWTVGQRYDYKYVGIIISTIVIAIGSPLLGVVTVLSTEHKAEARVLSYVFVQVALGVVFYVYNLVKGKRIFDAKYWRFALTFSLPLIPHYLSMTLLNQSDRIMISHLVGDAEAAIYSLAYMVAMMMNVVTNAINDSFIPYTYKSIKENNIKGIRTNSSFLLVLVGAICIVVMAFGPEVIRIAATEEYYDAIWVIPPLAAAIYFMFLYPLFANVEFYFEKTKYIMVASGVGAVLNIILNALFIPICGYQAAGYTTLVCYILFVFAHYYFYKKIIKKELPEEKDIYDMRFIVMLSAVVLIAMLVMTLTYEYIIIRYGIVCVIGGAVVYKRKYIVGKFKELKK